VGVRRKQHSETSATGDFLMFSAHSLTLANNVKKSMAYAIHDLDSFWTDNFEVKYIKENN
jgi:hypothetical protein